MEPILDRNLFAPPAQKWRWPHGSRAAVSALALFTLIMAGTVAQASTLPYFPSAARTFSFENAAAIRLHDLERWFADLAFGNNLSYSASAQTSTASEHNSLWDGVVFWFNDLFGENLTSVATL